MKNKEKEKTNLAELFKLLVKVVLNGDTEAKKTLQEKLK